MTIEIEAIIFYLILLDAITANIIAFAKPKWYKKKYKKLSTFFPLTKGWTLLYLVLVLWIGWALLRLSILP